MSEGEQTSKQPATMSKDQDQGSLTYKRQQRNGIATNAKKSIKKATNLLAAAGKINKIAAYQLINSLEKYAERLGTLDDFILSRVTDEQALGTEVVAAEQLQSDIGDVVAEIRATLTVASEPVAAASTSPGPSTSTGASQEGFGTKVSLPKLHIKKFSGDPKQWQRIWDSFSSMIDSNENLSPIAKQQYLRSYLTGNAERLADGLRMTNDTYDLLIDRLKERYGDPELAIFAHFDSMLSMKPAGKSAADLQRIFDECENHIGSLVTLGLSEDTFGRVFTPIILSKLPQETRIELHRRKGQEKWSLEKLRTLLKDEIYALEMGKQTLGSSAEPDTRSGKAGTRQGQGGDAGSSFGSGGGKAKMKVPKNRKCFFCSDTEHYTDDCGKFPDLESRLEQLSDRCMNCLGQTHEQGKECRNTRPCYHCKQRGHHRSLCPEKFSSEKGARAKWPAGSSRKSPGAKKVMTGVAQGGVAYLQTAIAKAEGSKRSVEVQLVLDIGATRTFVRNKTARQIGAKPLTSELIAVGGFGDASRTTKWYQSYEFTLYGQNGEAFQIIADGTDTVTPPASVYPLHLLADQYPTLRTISLAQPLASTDAEIQVDILIGGDYYYDLVQDGRIQCGKNLVLLKSVFGYVAAGRIERPQTLRRESTLLVDRKAVPVDVDVEKFWLLEEIGIKDAPGNKEDQRAVELFNESVQFDESAGRYMVKWPWRDNVHELPQNLGLASGRLKACLRRLKGSKQHMETYQQVIQTQVDRDIIEEVPKKPDGEMVHYIPHHHVLNPESNTTPLRVVYDASCKPRKSVPSLNECMYRGPALWEDLCGLLIRFRVHKIALMADIEKAFLMIGLQKPDRDVARFLWVKDANQPPTGNNLIHYRFTRVCFGVVASSFLLSAVLTHHCQKVGTQTAKDLLDNCYVDNIIGGKEAVPEALKYCRESKEILREAGMNLREWYSNSQEVLDQIPKEEHGQGIITKVLGIKWDTAKDTLRCRIKNMDSNGRATSKREMLQQIARVYDPCGFFSPVLIPGKIIIQQLWKENRGWDERLPEKTCKSWDEVQENLHKIPTHEIPRLLPGLEWQPTTKLEIHCFCDASTAAYSAVVYLRAVCGAGVSVNLVFSKSRLCPVKPHTVPQLELVAIKIGTQAQQFVKSHLLLSNVPTVLWSDSQCALHWVLGKPVTPAFVKTNVKKIRTFTGITYRYVPTDQNPADLPTRGMSFEAIKSSKMWWHGPEWLKATPQSWPHNPIAVLANDAEISDSDEAEEATVLILQVSETIFDISRYGSLQKLLRVTVYVLRFINRARKKIIEPTLVCSATELEQAMQFWVNRVQRQAFSHLFRDRLSKREANFIQQNGIHKDDEGTVRCSGRTSNACVPDDAKKPILLPAETKFSDLVIEDVHRRIMHGGMKHTLAELRSKFWVFKARTRTKRMIKNCHVCQRLFGGSFQAPEAPALPKARVIPTEPFTNVGLDYLGPLTIHPANSDPQKAWICLFTCAVTRAVHLEVVSDMTTAQFLLCFRRHIALNGRPQLVISDNAKQFHAARNTLDKLFSDVCNDERVAKFSHSQGITWKFVVESAPWMGGFYERMVGIVKRSLKVAIEKTRLTRDELQVVVYEVAGIVNRRPLLYVEEEVGSEQLSPSQLIGRHHSLFPSTAGAQVDPDFLAGVNSHQGLMLQWKRLQNRLSAFWKSWSSSYLQSLRERQPSKQRGTSDVTPRIGIPVIIHEDLLPRSDWKVGVIESLNMSADGEIRSAKVRLPGQKFICRPISKLYPMETVNDSIGKDDKPGNDPARPQRPSSSTTKSKPTRAAAEMSRQKTRTILAAESSDDE